MKEIEVHACRSWHIFPGYRSVLCGADLDFFTAIHSVTYSLSDITCEKCSKILLQLNTPEDSRVAGYVERGES